MATWLHLVMFNHMLERAFTFLSSDALPPNTRTDTHTHVRDRQSRCYHFNSTNMPLGTCSRPQAGHPVSNSVSFSLLRAWKDAVEFRSLISL
jgi:hypothetical protein